MQTRRIAVRNVDPKEILWSEFLNVDRLDGHLAITTVCVVKISLKIQEWPLPHLSYPTRNQTVRAVNGAAPFAFMRGRCRPIGYSSQTGESTRYANGSIGWKADVSWLRSSCAHHSSS